MDVFREVECTTNNFVVKSLLGTCYVLSNHAQVHRAHSD